MLHNATLRAARSLHKTLHAARSLAAARRAMSSSLLRLGGVPEHFNLPVRKAAARPEPPFTWTEYPGGRKTSEEVASSTRVEDTTGRATSRPRCGTASSTAPSCSPRPSTAWR